ncbi:MAG: efflux RND transporter periplasmic adaptor subunit [Cyclobacteriaceae bacterium]
MNVKKFAVAGIAVLILGSGFLAMKKFAGMKESPTERPKLPSANYVKVSSVAYKEMDTEVVAYGRITSSQTLSIIAEVGGRLLPGAVELKPGVNFRQGQVLCRIYGEEARLTLQSRKSEFLNLIASSLPDFRIDYPEAYPSWQTYFEQIEMDQPLQELPEANNNKLKTFLATKNILRDYYNIKSLEENLRKYTIYAPYDGSIVDVNFEVGTIVNPGTNIASLIRTDRMELEIPLEINNIKWVEEGSAVEVMSEDGSQSWIGRIARIADFVDPATQSINVYVSIEAGPNSGLYDGMYLKTVIPGTRLGSAMEIPRRVLQNENEVFVVEQGVLRTRQVNIEKITRDQVLISPLDANSLAEGDSLVIEAPANAIENMKVTTFDATRSSQPGSDNKTENTNAQTANAS